MFDRGGAMKKGEANLRKVNDYIWEMPATGGMNVPVRIYADTQLAEHIKSENVLDQAINVSFLPGIIGASFAMPDAHWGYGFPIGGVAAFDPAENGVISPGGIGFDINCGVRMIRTDLGAERVRERIEKLINTLYSAVPSGVGSSDAVKQLGKSDMRKVMTSGARWAVESGWGTEDDLLRTEDGGAMTGADPASVSSRAVQRGGKQLGTLGSGNHFLEVDVVDEVYDDSTARVFGVEEGTVVLQVHCGSRGFGHQICSDYLKVMQGASRKYGIDLPDRQLACAPLESSEGQRYFGAMAAGANFAWCNRQIIQALALKAFTSVFGSDPEGLGWRQIYDVCHNIAKFEKHDCGGVEKKLCVHRKGATRAFAPGRPEVPGPYAETGQPVLIPGDMGTSSYLLAGTRQAMQSTWGSTCHGAGRVMSRKGAIRHSKGRKLVQDLRSSGVTVRASGKQTIAEEMPYAYKDVDSVVNVMEETGITRKIARFKPLGVVKG